MSALLHLRLSGGLVEIARAMRVLKRYSIYEPRISAVREGPVEVTVVHGRLFDAECSFGLARALSRLPGLIEAAISREDEMPDTRRGMREAPFKVQFHLEGRR